METVRQIKVADLIPTKDNCRIINPKDKAFLALAEDISKNGVQIPVIARPHPTQEGKFDLRCGERRLLAAKLMKLETIPVMVYEKMTDEEAKHITFKENFNRADLTPRWLKRP